jgi:PRTRC genetic system protein C
MARLLISPRSLIHEQFSYNTTQDRGDAPMALQASALPREFFYNGSHIPDPDTKMEIDQVRELLTPSYPEIATATMTGPEDTGTALRYTFSRAIGSKG